MTSRHLPLMQVVAQHLPEQVVLSSALPSQSTHLKPLAGAGLQVVHVHALMHEAITALHLEQGAQAGSLVLGRGAGEDLGGATGRAYVSGSSGRKDRLRCVPAIRNPGNFRPRCTSQSIGHLGRSQ